MSAQGFGMIPRWLLYAADVTPQAKLVYAVIQSHTNENGTAWPSQQTIARESGLSHSTVKRACALLAERGLVTWAPRVRKGGGKGSNVYRVATTRPVDKAGDNSAIGHADLS